MSPTQERKRRGRQNRAQQDRRFKPKKAAKPKKRGNTDLETLGYRIH